ncbi:MAG: hypothetical protein Fur0032_12510 [Terrimicrobiaceae bacterium]
MSSPQVGRVLYWADLEPRGPTVQMAIDELLLEYKPASPVLRHYLWDGRCASFGVFQSHHTARAEAPGYTLVRRWTAGGVVRHDRDWTFSLVLPSGSAQAGERPGAVYCWIHRAVASVLGRRGIDCRLAGAGDQIAGPSCFQSPASGDVLGKDGTKLCGGAQRRTKSGVLHQGSLQGVFVEPDFLNELASAMYEYCEAWEPGPEILAAANGLAASKYGSASWLNRVP